MGPAVKQVRDVVVPESITVQELANRMTITSNNPTSFTYQAELIGADKPVAARSCALPPDGRLSFESWPQKANAIRLSDFKVAPKGGACP